MAAMLADGACNTQVLPVTSAILQRTKILLVLFVCCDVPHTAQMTASKQKRGMVTICLVCVVLSLLCCVVLSLRCRYAVAVAGAAAVIPDSKHVVKSQYIFKCTMSLVYGSMKLKPSGC